MNNLFDELRELHLEYEFNEFLKSLSYDKNKEYDELTYEYFTIQWIGIWVKDIDYILKNKDILKNDFKKILKCQKVEVKGYLINQMLKDIVENNIDYKKTYENILYQKYKMFFDIIKKDNDLSEKKINENNIFDKNKNKDNTKKNDISLTYLSTDSTEIPKKDDTNEIKKNDLKIMIDEIDIHKIYKIDDNDKNTKKRKFGEYFDDNDLTQRLDNNPIKKNKVKKNITIEISKKDNNLDYKNSLFEKEVLFKNLNNYFKNDLAQRLDNNKEKNDYFLNTLGEWKKECLIKIKKNEEQKKERNDRYKSRINNNKQKNNLLSKNNKDLIDKINKNFNLLKENKNKN